MVEQVDRDAAKRVMNRDAHWQKHFMAEHFARHRTEATAARDALLTQVAATVTQDATGRWYFDLGDPEQLIGSICEAVGHDAVEAARAALNDPR